MAESFSDWLQIGGAVSTKAGFGKAGANGSGSKFTIKFSEQFSAWLGIANPAKSGYGTVGGVGSGSKRLNNQTIYTKSGYATVGGNGAGPSASLTQETGRGLVGCTATGARTVVHTIAVHDALIFVCATEFAPTFTTPGFKTKSGFGVAGTVGAGSRARTLTKTGFAKVGGIGAGPEVHTATGPGTIIQLGHGVAGLTAAGAKAVVYVESGRGVAGLTARGTTSTVLGTLTPDSFVLIPHSNDGFVLTPRTPDSIGTL